MRQIFSSPRLENVEAVEQLLEQAGIQTKVSDRATWNRATKRDFSYTDRSPGGRWPAVWVVQAEDYPKARQILRDIGLIDSPREAALDTASRGPSYLGDAANETPYVPPERRAARLRLVIFAITLGLAIAVVVRMAGM
jgi:hypothetical protein